jgi:hypothetical protein
VGLPLLCSSALGQSDTPTIDHVRVLVHDIAAAQNNLHAIGFEMRRPEPSVYQEGSAHSSAPFSDGTYLELIAIADREKLSKSRPWIVDFLQNYQGAHSVGIIVTSAKDVADRLQSQGIDAPLFTLIGSHPEAKPVLLTTPKLANLADGAIFFVEYPSKRSSPAQVSQPNTAEGTIAVWILVKDLEKASKDVERIGFHAVRLLKFDVLGARKREFNIGRLWISLACLTADFMKSNWSKESQNPFGPRVAAGLASPPDRIERPIRVQTTLPRMGLLARSNFRWLSGGIAITSHVPTFQEEV